MTVKVTRWSLKNKTHKAMDVIYGVLLPGQDSQKKIDVLKALQIKGCKKDINAI